jgi:hypothetical protein
MSIRGTFWLATAAALMVVIVALLTLLGVKSAEAALAGFPEGHGPIALDWKDDAQMPVSLHSGRTFYFDPEPPPKRPIGCLLRHRK